MNEVAPTTMAPPGNMLPYIIPLQDIEKSPCGHIWHTFSETMKDLNAHDDKFIHPVVQHDYSNRLSVFLSLDGSIPRASQEGQQELPHITGGMCQWLLNAKPSSSVKDRTWKEIILGLPEDGKWLAALHYHHKKKDSINKYSQAQMPLSTNPFVGV